MEGRLLFCFSFFSGKMAADPLFLSSLFLLLLLFFPLLSCRTRSFIFKFGLDPFDHLFRVATSDNRGVFFGVVGWSVD